MVLAHLYYDLSNLFGSSGNIKVINRYLKDVNIKTELRLYSVGDKIPFNEIDLFFIGEVSDDNLEIIKKDILKYKKDIKKYIDSDKFVFISGKTLDLFGNDGLKIFDFSPIKLEKRITGEFTAHTKDSDQKIIALYNEYSKIINKNNYWFSYDREFKGEKHEGIHYKNFYGTYFIGPILVRNPYLTENIVNNLIKSNNLSKKGNYNNKMDIQAYEYYFTKK